MWHNLAKWTTGLSLAFAGCASGPLQENPVVLGPQKSQGTDNPVYLPNGAMEYGAVFEKVIDALDDTFEIAYTNRYEGRIETFPLVAAGIGQIWKPGSPDMYQRLLATFQSIRYRAVVLISPARDGGFFVDVKVYRELEDVAQPLKAGTASAVFRSDNTPERQFEVVDATTYNSAWIPSGRETKLEQSILNRLVHCNIPPPKAPTPPTNP